VEDPGKSLHPVTSHNSYSSIISASLLPKSTGELGRFSLTNAYLSIKVEFTLVDIYKTEIDSPTIPIRARVPNDSNFLALWSLILLDGSTIICSAATYSIEIIGITYGNRTWPPTEKNIRNRIIHNIIKISTLDNPV
jgi:hypothetical protein